MKTSLEKAPDAEPGSMSESGRPTSKHPNPSKPAAAALAIKRILVAIDFSHASARTLEVALTLAESHKATLTLLHIVEPRGFPEKFLAPGGTLDESTQQELEMARERLAAVYPKKHGRQLAADSLVRMGRAYSEICDTAKALAADLIVIGTHGVRHTSLGSTVDRVLRQAACPVLVVPFDVN